MFFHCKSQYVSVALLIVLAALSVSTGPALASVCRLADHIKSANTNTAVGFCPAGTSHDIITIAEDITLTEPLPPITGTITIEGGGHTISGDGKFRIFDVQGGNLTIKNLTLTEGRADHGAAIRLQNSAYVAIEDSTISENLATRGGGIVTTGAGDQLTISRSSFIGNESANGHDGGAILAEAGSVDISSSRFSENYGGFFGGAIKSLTEVNVSNTTFDNNSALVGGAVIDVSGGVTTMTHVTMVGNRGGQGNGPRRHISVSGIRYLAQ